jgi:hypothetical protein
VQILEKEGHCSIPRRSKKNLVTHQLCHPRKRGKVFFNFQIIVGHGLDGWGLEGDLMLT